MKGASDRIGSSSVPIGPCFQATAQRGYFVHSFGMAYDRGGLAGLLLRRSHPLEVAQAFI
jgi:hypothetical protein